MLVEVRKYEGKQRRHFRITTILVEPYVMKAKSLSNVTDEIQYEVTLKPTFDYAT